MQAIPSQDDYLFVGNVLRRLADKHDWTMEIEGHDPQLSKAFRIAGGGHISDEDLSSIERHEHVLYLLSRSVSITEAWDTMQAAIGLLNAGGLAVKVESAGTAHAAQQWREYSSSENLFDLYRAYVTLIGGDYFYSCGMKNLALPDSAVERTLSLTDAADLLNRFNLYILNESPTLRSGETFSFDATSRRYKLIHESDRRYASDESFYNPFGIWKLNPVPQ